MKTLKLLLSGTVLSGWMSVAVGSQPAAVIKLDLGRKIAQINPNAEGNIWLADQGFEGGQTKREPGMHECSAHSGASVIARKLIGCHRA